MKRIALFSLAVGSLVAVGSAPLALRQLGKQPDGSFMVSSGQHIQAGTIHFAGRPSEIALRPQGDVFAITAKDKVFLATENGPVAGSEVNLEHDPGFRGIAWNSAGTRLYITTAERHDDKLHDGALLTFDYANGKLTSRGETVLSQAGEPSNPVPGGLALTKNDQRLFVAAGDLNGVLELDAATGKRIRKIATGMIPFTTKLTEDESTLIVSNWGGHVPTKGERTAKTGISEIAIDEKGAPASGTVSIIDLASGSQKVLEVGIHPTDVLVAGDKAYVANAMSDSISEIDWRKGIVSRTIPMRYGSMRVIGAMPCALARQGDTLYVCDGGDNALAEVDLKQGQVKGYRPAGYFPISLFLKEGKAYVLNSKGNGSVARTAYGKPGNVHDFEGTVSIIDLSKELAKETAVVAENNEWSLDHAKPNLAVFNGAIQHVLYIIKENRTYDEMFGDMPEGNGDASLCILGEKAVPNHRAIAREFTLFDNAYVSGTNSADGHAWSTQSMANDYLEHFYVGYSRTYPDDGDCAMSISNAGGIWDAVLKKKKTIRDYGEFCDDALAEYAPNRPKDWFDAWEDRRKATHKFTYTAHTRVASLKPYIHPTVHYWPLIQSDQSRADEFIKDYSDRVRSNTVANLMILSLCCDHTEGLNPEYPAPRSMVADNDLALGRVIDAVSHSPQWKNTAIFVIEDDAQNGPDHVDGHRTPYLVVSPYNKRHVVDHNLYTTASMLRTIELMLGLDPMNKFDAMAHPISTCFNNEPDLTPYNVRPNNVPLDEPNPGRRKVAMSKLDQFYTLKTKELDWSHPDGPDSYWLNRIIWHSLTNGTRPYPGRATDRPGEVDTD